MAIIDTYRIHMTVIYTHIIYIYEKFNSLMWGSLTLAPIINAQLITS